MHITPNPLDVTICGPEGFDCPEKARISFTENTLARVRELRTLVAQQGLAHAAVDSLPDLKVKWLIEEGGDVGENLSWGDHDSLNPSPEPVLVGADHVTYAEKAFGVGLRIACNLEEAFRVALPLSLRDREKQGLIRFIEAMATRGWHPLEAVTGDEWEDVRDLKAEQVVEECAATDEGALRFLSDNHTTGVVELVWGNSPSELVADHSCSHGFDEAVDAALHEVFPGYPCCED